MSSNQRFSLALTFLVAIILAMLILATSGDAFAADARLKWDPRMQRIVVRNFDEVASPGEPTTATFSGSRIWRQLSALVFFWIPVLSLILGSFEILTRLLRHMPMPWANSDAKPPLGIAPPRAVARLGGRQSPLPSSGQKRLTGLSIASIRSRPQFNTKQAAGEYLDLLWQLSRGFTSPEGKAGRVVKLSGEIVDRGYSGDSQLLDILISLTGNSLDDPSWAATVATYRRHAHSLRLADDIVHAEAVWRRGGELFDPLVYAQAKADLTAFTDASDLKTLLLRMVTPISSALQLERLENNYLRAKQGKILTQQANLALASALSYAYDPDYCYGHHHEKFGTTEAEKSRRNLAFNAECFSVERQLLIDRAIKLRLRLLPIEEYKGNDWYAYAGIFSRGLR